MTVMLTSRHDLTLDALRRVAWAGEGVAFSREALAHMTAARQRFMRLLEDPAVSVYGVTSGYGQNARVRLTPEQRTQHARRPPIQQAAGWGDPLPRVTRGIVFARLANFIDGGAAISPDVAQAVADMLDGRPLPTVPTRGQGGAGEILSLSHLFGELARTAPVAEKDVISLPINGSPAAPVHWWPMRRWLPARGCLWRSPCLRWLRRPSTCRSAISIRRWATAGTRRTMHGRWRS